MRPASREGPLSARRHATTSQSRVEPVEGKPDGES